MRPRTKLSLFTAFSSPIQINEQMYSLAAGLLIPGAEAVILLSCLVITVLVTRKIRFSSQINVIIVAFFAFFHGYAHGYVVSNSADFLSYSLGFITATILLHGAGIVTAFFMQFAMKSKSRVRL